MERILTASTPPTPASPKSTSYFLSLSIYLTKCPVPCKEVASNALALETSISRFAALVSPDGMALTKL